MLISDSATVAVAIEDLFYTYPDGRSALMGIHLRVHEGEKVALVGPNGAGKSTLLLQLNGILNGSGRRQIYHLSVEETNLRQVRGMVGLLFQNPDDQLFSPTVYEDVAFGLRYLGLPEDEVRVRVSAALQAVGMGASAGRISHHLSAGEKKRVALATILVLEPGILALDEPTDGLDPQARRILVTLLSRMPQTMLAATHDMRLVQQLFTRTVVMDQGCIVADGPTAEILQDAAFLEAHGLERPC